MNNQNKDIIPFTNNKNIVLPRKPRDNDGGGDGTMDNKYVTHTELELSNQKLLRHVDEQFNQLDKKLDANQAETNQKFENVGTKFESINTKLEKQKNDLVSAMLTITGAGVGFLSLLIAIISLLK